MIYYVSRQRGNVVRSFVEMIKAFVRENEIRRRKGKAIDEEKSTFFSRYLSPLSRDGAQKFQRSILEWKIPLSSRNIFIDVQRCCVVRAKTEGLSTRKKIIDLHASI